ncbi:MAG: DUF2787 family protein [Gammaproteobacteria bacterium]|nr:DUF2787 family protein [Gammaproteobacteria bacterium]
METELQKVKGTDGQTIILNFRDPTYSSVDGGYHPVEIMINEQGIILLIFFDPTS